MEKEKHSSSREFLKHFKDRTKMGSWKSPFSIIFFVPRTEIRVRERDIKFEFPIHKKNEKR